MRKNTILRRPAVRGNQANCVGVVPRIPPAALTNQTTKNLAAVPAGSLAAKARALRASPQRSGSSLKTLPTSRSVSETTFHQRVKLMPASVSDFCAQVNAATPASGARFSTVLNPDSSVSIFRRATAATVTGTLLYSRVVYTLLNDSVAIGDGSSLMAQNAPAFISSLS